MSADHKAAKNCAAAFQRSNDDGSVVTDRENLAASYLELRELAKASYGECHILLRARPALEALRKVLED